MDRVFLSLLRASKARLSHPAYAALEPSPRYSFSNTRCFASHNLFLRRAGMAECVGGSDQKGISMQEFSVVECHAPMDRGTTM